MAHHIWICFLTKEQKERWCRHLQENPTIWQSVVRRVYRDKKLYDSEDLPMDFAYIGEFPRHADIGELVSIGVISEDEMRRWEQASPPQELSLAR